MFGVERVLACLATSKTSMDEIEMSKQNNVCIVESIIHSYDNTSDKRCYILLLAIFVRLPMARALSRRTNFCVFPVEVLGKSSNTTVLGAM